MIAEQVLHCTPVEHEQVERWPWLVLGGAVRLFGVVFDVGLRWDDEGLEIEWQPIGCVDEERMG